MHFQPFKITKENAAPSSRVKVFETSEEFRIEIKWFSKKSRRHFFGIFYWLFFSALILILTSKIENSLDSKIFDVVKLVFLLAPAGGKLFLYLRDSYNQTTILLKKDMITFWTSPFSLRKPKSFATQSIRQLGLNHLTVKEEKGHLNLYFQINLHFDNREQIELFRADSMNEAMYIEGLIEKKLGLKDDRAFDHIHTNPLDHIRRGRCGS